MAFVTISRLASRRLLGAQYPFLKTYNVPALASSTASLQPSLIRKGEDYEDKNARLNRPMSPHVTIYRFGIPSILSITHRITGCVLTAYVYGLVGAAFCPVDFNTICTAIEAANLSSATIFTGKFLLAFPMAYHFSNGIRHLIWDSGAQLNKKAVVTTGSAMLAATAISTLLILFL